MHEQLIELSIAASLSAGTEILRVYESDDFEVETKGDNSPLTKADKEGNAVIMQMLEKTGIPILSEEGKSIPYDERKDWKQMWIVDPLDGTKEFIKRNGEFTVNIALWEEGKIVLGVVYAPVLDTLYFSIVEKGAFKLIEASRRIEEFSYSSLTSQSANLPEITIKDNYVVVGSRSHMNEETQAYVDEKKKVHAKVELISKGSSLKLCLVAEGLADAYPRFAPTMEWDTAAGTAIAIGAGAKVLDYKKECDLEYNKEDLLNPWFLVIRD